MVKRVTEIPATLNRFTMTPVYEPVKRKVAGYARVSTDLVEQQTSYENQVDYYTRYIKEHSDWEYVDIYTDEGISATSRQKREGFNRMIDDALGGKIDLIITKSVSRFARNTVDSLTAVRTLKEHGVEVYFEKENIWTLDAKGELLITIMSSLAQEESRSISENTTWGKRKSFEKGKVSVAYTRFLGYDADFKVNPEEAKTVKLIYKMFLSGSSYYAIKKEMEKRGIKAPAGGTKWHISSVKSILTNEKYKGDALLQKQYTVDFLTKAVKKNQGEIPQYYVNANHEAIIDPMTFDLVQIEIEKRKQGTSGHTGHSIFASKIKCAECGGWYGAKVWHSRDKYRRVIYRCNNKYKGEHQCQTPFVTEEEIKAVFVQEVNRLIGVKDEVIENLGGLIEKILGAEEYDQKLEEIKSAIKQAENDLNSMIGGWQGSSKEVKQDRAKYNARCLEYRKLKEKKEQLEHEVREAVKKKEDARRFLEVFNEQDGILTEFDENLWCALVEHVTVDAGKRMEVLFKGM